MNDYYLNAISAIVMVLAVVGFAYLLIRHWEKQDQEGEEIVDIPALEGNTCQKHGKETTPTKNGPYDSLWIAAGVVIMTIILVRIKNKRTK